MIKSQKADLVNLQETMVQESSMQMVKDLGVGRFLEWGAVEAEDWKKTF